MRRFFKTGKKFLRENSNNKPVKASDTIEDFEKLQKEKLKSLSKKAYQQKVIEFETSIYPDGAKFPLNIKLLSLDGKDFTPTFKNSNLFIVSSSRSTFQVSEKWIQEIQKIITSENLQIHLIHIYNHSLIFKFFKNSFLKTLQKETQHIKSIHLATAQKDFPFAYTKKYPSLLLFDESGILVSKVYGEPVEEVTKKLIAKIKSLIVYFFFLFQILLEKIFSFQKMFLNFQKTFQNFLDWRFDFESILEACFE